MQWALALLVMIGCGAGVRGTNGELDLSLSDAGMAKLLAATAVGDARSLRELIGDRITTGGLWFDDATCRAQFTGAGTVEGPGLDALAGCMSRWKVSPSERKNLFLGMAAITYEPGIELELVFSGSSKEPRLAWIGYMARRHADDNAPTVLQRFLESHRMNPAPLVLDDSTRGEIDRELAAIEDKPAWSWLKVCTDAQGQVVSAEPRMTTSLVAQRAFIVAIKSWRFRPVLLAGQPTAVCSLMQLGDAPARFARTLPMPVPDRHATAIVVSPELLKGRRTAGETAIAPAPRTRVALGRLGNPKLVGHFFLCIDEFGKVSSVITLQSTGSRSYDHQLATRMAGWRYEPLTFDGKPLAVCTHMTFIYTQR
ncbi:MAG: energy transducer TonB [Deltaproteobacteria bacterium]|nr:energy transducer TonB [Deltaproteobacteria bacterium]MDQ3299910.1 energy transducer TonB [Myxococcota bacterium]